jgi:Universal stress protein family
MGMRGAIARAGAGALARRVAVPTSALVQKILVCTDFSDAAAAGLRQARERFADAELVLLHVVDDELTLRASERTGLDRDELAQKAWSHADGRLEELVAAEQARRPRARGLLRRGDPAREAVAAAALEKVDCVVVGVDPLGDGAAGGRFRARLARSARVPVLIVFAEA